MNGKHLKAGYTQKEILIYGVVILLGILCVVFGVIALIWSMDSSNENNIIGNNTLPNDNPDTDNPPIFDDGEDEEQDKPGQDDETEDNKPDKPSSGDNPGSGVITPPVIEDDDITSEDKPSTGVGNNPSYTLAGNYFSSKGSLVYATSSNVKNIAKSYTEKVMNSYFINNINMSYKNSSGEEENLDLNGVFNKIFSTDRENFNNINWVNVGNLKTDSKTGLQYPSSPTYDLNYFIELLTPYLQSYSVPLSLSSGASSTYSDLVNYNFGVLIAEYAKHKLEVTRYDVNTTKTTEVQETVTTNKYIAKVNTTCTPEVDSEGVTYYVCSDKLIDSGRGKTPTVVGTQNNVISTSTSKSMVEKYVITKAYLLDTAINRAYTISRADTSNKNKATSTMVRSSEEKEANNTLNVSSNYTVYELPTIGEHNVEYTVDKVLKQTIDYVWSDLLNLNSNIQRTYTVADVISYIKNGEILDATSANYTSEQASLMTSGMLSTYELSYYKTYQDEGTLNLIDIINAVPSIYEQYIDREPRSTYIGYTRKYISAGYDILSKAMASLVDRGAWFAYGSSLGIKTVSTDQFDVSSITSLTMDGMSFPLNPDDLNLAKVTNGLNPRIQMQGPYGRGDKRVWGYANHSGIDIIWGAYMSQEARQMQNVCVDMYGSGYHCYIGGKLYTIMDMKLIGVYFSAYNKYYSTGVVNNSYQGSLKPGGRSGTYMIFETLDGMRVVYYHIFPDIQWLNEFAAKYTGKVIPAGTYVGYMGNTGNSTGTHLHLGIYANTSYSTSNYSLYFLISLIKKLTETGVDMSGLGFNTSSGTYSCSYGNVTCTDGIPNPVIEAWNAP